MTPDVTLRPVTEADLPVLYEHQRDPVSVHMAAFPSRDREEFEAHWTRILTDPSVVARAILLKDRLAGFVAIFGEPEERQVGYWIGREFWGKGIATRALAALLEEAPERPLFAHVAKHNVGSIRVLERCGFAVVGEDAATPGPDGEVVEDWILKL
jgi:RimJ/RimL family protein N-acetyltransferase